MRALTCADSACSNTIGVPSAGTSAHRTDALMLYTVMMAVPVAYRMLPGMKKSATSAPAARMAACRLASRSARSVGRSTIEVSRGDVVTN
jgi:hypothetical protein